MQILCFSCLLICINLARQWIAKNLRLIFCRSILKLARHPNMIRPISTLKGERYCSCGWGLIVTKRERKMLISNKHQSVCVLPLVAGAVHFVTALASWRPLQQKLLFLYILYIYIFLPDAGGNSSQSRLCGTGSLVQRQIRAFTTGRFSQFYINKYNSS